MFKVDKEKGFLFPKQDLYVTLIYSKSVLNYSDSIFVCHPGEYTPAGMHMGQWKRTVSLCQHHEVFGATVELLAEFVL